MVNSLKYIFCFLLVFFSFPRFFAQENNTDTTSEKTFKNSIFIELGGATGYFSLNYDRDIQVFNKLHFIPGVGVGFVFDTDYTPGYILSYALRADFFYGDKRIKPVVGYVFSQNFDLEYFENNYFAHSLTAGVDFKILKRFNISPRYYLMFINETNYDSIYIIHWSGLQLKYHF
ncbi:MAG: hypothetical protein COX70_10150 [Flavobacteriales bacterium CG_4_10_14_0_2_um_filter_32_8]|nr:MAG: hypothetical protein COX70_10150 [Flavobacteriales bacterium CG_4_10_14_0_2_um_filter_32_8]